MGWPLLTVETEVNGDSKSTNDWLVRLACRAGTKIFFLPWLLYSRPSTKYFFPSPCVPIAQQAGQAVVLGRLSLSMCLWADTPVYQLRSSELPVPTSNGRTVPFNFQLNYFTRSLIF